MNNRAQSRRNLADVAPTSFEALQRLNLEVESNACESGVDELLVELVRLRVSQLNGCRFCTDLHTRRSLERGESEQRLEELASWTRSSLFTEGERAALRLAESITRLNDGPVPEEDYATAEKYFDDKQLAGVVWTAALINTYNRLASAMSSTG